MRLSRIVCDRNYQLGHSRRLTRRVSQRRESVPLLVGRHWPGVAAFGDFIIVKAFTRVRAIANLLRLAAISVYSSGVTFLLPVASIDSFLVWCGLEQVPHVRLMRYVLFAAGLLQVGIGVVVWVIARHVVR